MAAYRAERIHLENLRVRCIIGVHPHEREQPQELRISLAFPWDFAAAARTDTLADTVDYAAIAQTITTFAQQGRFSLLETLARRLAAELGQRFALPWLKLHVHKPSALPQAEGAAVSLLWRMENRRMEKER